MPSTIDPQIEKVLQSTIFPDLLKGRADFDLPHTKAVVHWMKILLSEINNPVLDPKVLITAAYAHDWGYIGLFDGINSNDPKEISKRKPLHMKRGAVLIRRLIDDKLSKYFTTQQKELTSHLVSIHDKVEELTTESEKLIMEADTLGMLDTDLVKPTFSKQDNNVFIEREIKKRRLPAFLHNSASKAAQHLVSKREHVFD